MSNRFYFGEDNDSNTSLNEHENDNDASSLPFPKPLDRSAFLVPDFDPATFLSSLSNRFQTLEDLQDELRELSQSLNRELVDLVNDNYQDFLSLGTTLSGGEEKVEEIRVGLLGFQRDVGGVRDKVEARKVEVQDLLTQKKTLRREVSKGRVLLEIAERLDYLEDQLRIVNPHRHAIDTDTRPDDDQVAAVEEPWSADWNVDPLDDDDEYDEETGVSSRLRNIVEQHRIVHLLIRKHNQQHPFLVSQRERIAKIYDVIRIDLETAISQEDDIKLKQKIIQLRSTIDE